MRRARNKVKAGSGCKMRKAARRITQIAGKFFRSRRRKNSKRPQIGVSYARSSLARRTLEKKHDYPANACSRADGRSHRFLNPLPAVGWRTGRGRADLHRRQNVREMRSVRTSTRCSPRRFLEVWRAGRPDLQKGQEETFLHTRRGLFDHETRRTSPAFQVFGPRQERTGARRTPLEG